MRKDNQQMIDEYYNNIKDKFPGLTKEECTKCCITPFEYAKQEMESGEFPTIRFKYLGTLVVYPKRVIGLYETLKKQWANLTIDSKTYFPKKEIYEKYIKKHKDVL